MIITQDAGLATRFAGLAVLDTGLDAEVDAGLSKTLALLSPLSQVD
jgi:hypothetical protein